jgi:hypothetical protein
MNDRTFGISFIGFLLVVEGLGWWIGTVVQFSTLLKIQVYLLGPRVHAWLFSKESLDTIYLLFFKNPVVLFFGGILLMTIGTGLILLKPWARYLLLVLALFFITLAVLLLAQGGNFAAGWIIFWGLVSLYAASPRIRQLFHEEWQDSQPASAPRH